MGGQIRADIEEIGVIRRIRLTSGLRLLESSCECDIKPSDSRN